MKTKEEEGALTPAKEAINNPMIGKAAEKKPTPAQIKEFRKEQAMQLANYKKRLRESVEMKELQVREIELNIKYYNVSKEYAKIEEILQEEEAKKQAQIQKEKEEANKAPKSKLEVVRTGVGRTDAEIEEGKKL